jgi:hypothetical protein
MNSTYKQLSFSKYLRPVFHGAALAFFFGLPLTFALAALGTLTKEYHTDEHDTLKTLHNAGYNLISIGGGVHPFLKHDFLDENGYGYATRFKAIGANGTMVSGYVENGNWWRTSRIVFDYA